MCQLKWYSNSVGSFFLYLLTGMFFSSGNLGTIIVVYGSVLYPPQTWYALPEVYY